MTYKPSRPAAPNRTHVAVALLISVVLFYQPYHVRQCMWRTVLDTTALYAHDDYTTKLYVVLYGGMLLHTAVCVVLHSTLAYLYYAQHAYFEQYKVQRNTVWPWRDTAAVRTAYWRLMRKAAATFALNNYVVVPLCVLASVRNTQHRLDSDMQSLPHWHTTLWQVAVCMLVSDTCSYWAHRALHHRLVYRYVHKQHHAFTQSVGIASEYTHPVEYVLGNMLPFIVGPLLLRAHLYTVAVWYVWTIGEAVDGHSGYGMHSC